MCRAVRLANPESITVAAPGPDSRCACACTTTAPQEEYAGFWCGGSCKGTQDFALPDDYNTIALTIGMHYNNP